MTTPSAILVENVTKTYRRGRVRALDRISLETAPGRVVGVIGPNGAGKTTLFGCVVGLLTPDSGRVLIGGRAPDTFAARAEIGYLPERLAFDRWMRGEDFLAYHHALSGGAKAERQSRIAEALERVELTPSEARRPLKTYSRGMLQRIGLAQALIAEPRYVLLDEPTSGMDPTGLAVLRRALDELRARGATVLMNSHQLDHVERLCDTIYFVYGGAVADVTDQTDSDAVESVRVRVHGARDVENLEAALGAAALAAGASFVTLDGDVARFSVVGDAGAATLAVELVRAGVRFAEFAPDRSRLERLFFERGRAAR